MEGKGSLRLLTPLVESFSADLLPDIKSYWTVTFYIVYIALREGYKIVAYNATFVGVGRK